MAKEMAMTKVESSSTGTKVKRGILGVIINFALWFFSLTCIFPLIWMLYSSLKTKRVFNADIAGWNQCANHNPVRNPDCADCVCRRLYSFKN